MSNIEENSVNGIFWSFKIYICSKNQNLEICPGTFSICPKIQISKTETMLKLDRGPRRDAVHRPRTATMRSMDRDSPSITQSEVKLT